MSRIQVMISSRCDDPVPDGETEKLLSDVRLELQRDVESLLVLDGRPSFEVWISETAEPAGGDHDAWEECMRRARNCDVFVCLFNGHSGWAEAGSSVGICHAELQTAVDSAPERVRLILVEPDRSRSDSPEREWDARFRRYVDQLSLFRGTVATNATQVRNQSMHALRSAVVDLARTGARSSRMGSAYQGEALEWNRLDFLTRKAHMEEAVIEELLVRGGTAGLGDRAIIVPIATERVLFGCHAIPAALTIAQARELVGQPFLSDHHYRELDDIKVGGPVHLIACYGNVTDSQARRQLGFPDATVISPPFGVWVADPVQKIQMLFLAGCVDSSSTRHQVQRAFDWLTRTGEEQLLAVR
jgi:hypothetical protein